MINTRKSREHSRSPLHSITNSPVGEEEHQEMKENMFGIMVPVDRSFPVCQNKKPKMILEGVTVNDL